MLYSKDIWNCILQIKTFNDNLNPIIYYDSAVEWLKYGLTFNHSSQSMFVKNNLLTSVDALL